MEFKENVNKFNPDYTSIEFKGKWVSMEVTSADKSGDVEIRITEDGDEKYIFINQENLKQLITHLQKQVK